MKFLVALIVVLSSLTLNAKSLDVVKKESVSYETTAVSSHIDGKKARRHKRINKRRKRACANWGKRSYAG
ncbi:MAG: hypothetical protein RI883_774 [Bacteroidota bacterium]|jgi:hypothetical protein